MRDLINFSEFIKVDIRVGTIISADLNKELDNFNLLKEWIEKTKFERLGCFKYSHEENTYAFSLDDNVSEKEKNQRVDQVMKIQSKISLDFNKRCIGRAQAL